MSDVIGLRKVALMEYYYMDSIGFALFEGFGKRFVTEIVLDTDDDDLTEEEKLEAREMLPSRVAVAEDADIEEITDHAVLIRKMQPQNSMNFNNHRIRGKTNMTLADYIENIPACRGLVPGKMNLICTQKDTWPQTKPWSMRS